MDRSNAKSSRLEFQSETVISDFIMKSACGEEYEPLYGERRGEDGLWIGSSLKNLLGTSDSFQEFIIIVIVGVNVAPKPSAV
jgi:hypothetical protein